MSGPVIGPVGDQRIVVTRGGEPDPAQVAALVVALAPAPGPPDPTGPPAWRRAALLEGIGGPRILAPGDLGVLARPG